VNLTQIVLSAVTTEGLITILFGAKDVSDWNAIVSAIVSPLLLALNAYKDDATLNA
jgi:hypothetical protein